MTTRILLLFVFVLAVWMVVKRPRGRGPAAREWRDVLFARGAAFVIGAIVASAAAQELELGRGVMLAPALVGLAVVAGVALGETVVRPRPWRGVRAEPTQQPRLGAYAAMDLVMVTVAAVVVHAATLVATTMTASADDMGRAGRAITHQCATGAQTRSPYPGNFYSLPLAAVLLLAGVVTIVALVVVVRWPRGFAPDGTGEDGLRRRSVTTIVSAFGAAVAASQAGIASYAGIALVGMDACAATWMRPTGVVMLATVVPTVIAVAWFLGRVVVPEPTR